MRSLPADIITALNDGVFRPLWLVEIDFDTPLKFCSSYDTVSVDGVTYTGAGNLGRVGKVEENTDLDPTKLQVTLSGINPAILSTVGDSNYLNREGRIRMAMLDENGAILGNTSFLYFRGKTDEVRFNRGGVATVNITLRDALADWGRPRIQRNMNADQQARYPGDKGFEYVAQIASKDIVWPAGGYYED